MSRGVRKSYLNLLNMKNESKISFLETFIVKKDFANILDGTFFLTRRRYLGILESIMFNSIKYLWVCRQLLASLML